MLPVLRPHSQLLQVCQKLLFGIWLHILRLQLIFRKNRTKNDSVISKNESWGTYATLIIFKEFLKLLLRNSSPHFRKRDMKFSTEAVLVSLLDFLLFLWKTTHLGMCWTYKEGWIYTCLPDLLRSQNFRLFLCCRYCREWAGQPCSR